MSVNSQNTKRGLNAFDIILLLVVAAVVVMLAVWAIGNLPGKEGASGDVSVNYVISVSDLPEGIGEQLAEGQRLYQLDSGVYIGEITAVTVEKHIVKTVDLKKGEPVANTVDGRYDIKITVLANARYGKSGYRVNGVLLSCGETYGIRTSDIALEGSCISITAH